MQFNNHLSRALVRFSDNSSLGSKLVLFCLLRGFLIFKLEDLKVLRRPPDLFNNVKIGEGQLPLILIKHILFYHIWGLQPF